MLKIEKSARLAICGVVVATAAFAMTNATAFARRASHTYSYTGALVNDGGATLPRPAFQATPVLLYRSAPDPARSHQGIGAWVYSDGPGGTIRLRAMASGGHAADPVVVQGSGHDLEPTWPAWISDPIGLTWTGWKRVDVPLAALTYRQPSTASSTAAVAKFADADAVGIDTTRRKGVLYVSSLEWDGADGTAATSVPIDNFSSGAARAWRVHGTLDALRAVAWKVGVMPPIPHLGRYAMKLNFAPAAMADAVSMAYLKQMVSLSDKPCVVLVPNSPFDWQSADALPKLGEANLIVDAFACANQVQSAAFDIYAVKPLTNVTVTQRTALATVGHNMPASAVDIKVVERVKEHGTGPYVDPDATGTMPGLLVKDDSQALENADGTLATVRLTGDPRTDIPAHTQKQFWITIDVPKNTPSGTYLQVLGVSADQLKPFTVTLNVTVMSMNLMSPSKQYAIAFSGKLGRGPSRAAGDADTQLADETQYLQRDQFQAQLTDIAQHGFRYATLTDQGPALWDAVDAYMSVPGLGYPFLYTGFSSVRDAEAVDNERAKRKLDPFYYLDSNPASLSQDAAAFKAAGMESAVIVPDDDSLPQGIDSLSLAIHQTDDPYVQRLVAGGERESNQRDWLAWRSADPNPQVDRLYTGFLLFRSNMYGAYAMDYQNAAGGDPFKDDAPRSDGYAGLRPQMLTYPVSGGIVDTVQWEAAREGVTDVRYLTTFYAALRECKDNHVDMSLLPIYEANVKALIARVSWANQDAQLQADRLTIANYALRLRTDVDHYYATHGGG